MSNDITDEMQVAIANIVAERMQELRAEMEENFHGDPILAGQDMNRTDFCDISPGGGSGITTDYVYVGGNRLEVPEKTTSYLKVYLDGTTSPEWVEAMPETQDSDAEVFDVRKNRIHLPGNFGG
jgi:hypothetical protein